MRSAAVLTKKPMMRASLSREPVARTLAMILSCSLALVRLIWALGEWALLGKLTERACSRGTGNGLEIFRMDIQWKTDWKSWPRGQKLAADSSLKWIMGASLQREPVTGAQEMAWRSTQGRDIQFWALGRLEICRDVQQNDSETHTFSGQKRPFFAVFCPRRHSSWFWGLLGRVSLNPGHLGVADWTKISSIPKIRVRHFDLFC